MIQKEKHPIPDPDSQPEAWKNAETLHSLYVDRGWPRSDIADYFGIEEADVRRFLYRHEIERDKSNSQAPTNGLARRLFEKGKSEAVK